MSDAELRVEEREEMPDAEGGEGGGLPDGIIRELGELGPGAIISEAALARMLGRSQCTLKRAVQRNELPPPVRLLGGPIWTAGAIVAHLERRLEEAAKEREKLLRRISQNSP